MFSSNINVFLSVICDLELELETNLPEVSNFTVTEKALTRTFSWLKVPIKILLRHYAKHVLSTYCIAIAVGRRKIFVS